MSTQRTEWCGLAVPDYLWERLRPLPPDMREQLRMTLNAHQRYARSGRPHHADDALAQLSKLASMTNLYRDSVVYRSRDELAAMQRRRTLNDMLDTIDAAQRMTKRQRAQHVKALDRLTELEMALDVLRRIVAALARDETDGTRI